MDDLKKEEHNLMLVKKDGVLFQFKKIGVKYEQQNKPESEKRT